MEATHAAPPAPAAAARRAPWTTAIVVGASSGIGAELVRELAARGVNVAALGRRAAELQRVAEQCRGQSGRVLVLPHDVRLVGEVDGLLERAAVELGPPDLLIYAAAVMSEVGPQEYDTGKDLDMLAINLGGLIAWCNALAGLLRSQRRGTIVGISSIAGERGRKPAPVYGTTKAAMNHYLEALRNRLSEFGVHVCTIKPGYVDTVMTQGKRTFWLISARSAARAILSAAARRADTRWVPRRWALVGLTLRAIPSFLFRRLNF
jgi:short-subunit dehydrogenase